MPAFSRSVSANSHNVRPSLKLTSTPTSAPAKSEVPGMRAIRLRSATESTSGIGVHSDSRFGLGGMDGRAITASGARATAANATARNATTVAPMLRRRTDATPSNCRGTCRAIHSASTPPSIQAPICNVWCTIPAVPNAIAEVTAAVAEPVGDQCQPHCIHTGRNTGSTPNAVGHTTVRQRAAAITKPFQPNNTSRAHVSSAAITRAPPSQSAGAQPTVTATPSPATASRTTRISRAYRWTRRALAPTPTDISATITNPSTSAPEVSHLANGAPAGTLRACTTSVRPCITSADRSVPTSAATTRSSWPTGSTSVSSVLLRSTISTAMDLPWSSSLRAERGSTVCWMRISPCRSSFSAVTIMGGATTDTGTWWSRPMVEKTSSTTSDVSAIRRADTSATSRALESLMVADPAGARSRDPVACLRSAFTWRCTTSTPHARIPRTLHSPVYARSRVWLPAEDSNLE